MGLQIFRDFQSEDFQSGDFHIQSDPVLSPIVPSGHIEFLMSPKIIKNNLQYILKYYQL